MTAADQFQKAQRALVARKKQMIAVIDRQAQRRLVVRPASPARVPRQFMHDDFPALARKLNRRRKTGKTGPDDMRRARSH